MKKKKGLIIVSAIAVVLVGFTIIKMKDYYNDRYVESDIVYVKVPEDQSQEIEDIKDDRGEVFEKGKEYNFVGITEKEETREVSFMIRTEDANELLKPNDYVRVSVSKTIVLGEKVISEDEVPENVLKLLNQ